MLVTDLDAYEVAVFSNTGEIVKTFRNNHPLYDVAVSADKHIFVVDGYQNLQKFSHFSKYKASYEVSSLVERYSALTALNLVSQY